MGAKSFHLHIYNTTWILKSRSSRVGFNIITPNNKNSSLDINNIAMTSISSSSKRPLDIDLNSSPPIEEPNTDVLKQNVHHLVEDPGILNNNIYLINLRCNEICHNDNFHIIYMYVFVQSKSSTVT